MQIVMNTIVKPLTGLTCLMLLAGNALYAQKTETSKEENIIIRKKGNTDEKMTIVIDGETVTVNGKPVDQYKDSAFDIHRFQRGETMNLDGFRKPGRFFFPRTPAVPDGGGRQMFIGTPNKAFLGVMTEKDTKGARITEVTPESAAAKAGLQKDDIITGVNDDKIADMDDLVKAIGKYKPEEQVKVTYLRNSKEATLTATLGKDPNMSSYFMNKDGEDFHFDMPEIQAVPAIPPFADGKALSLRFNRSPRLGLQVQDLEEGKGVKVLNTADGLPAAKAGIQKEDIITAVNGKAVNAVEELKEQLNGLKEGDTVELNYLRNNKKQSVQIKLPKKLQTSNL